MSRYFELDKDTDAQIAQPKSFQLEYESGSSILSVEQDDKRVKAIIKKPSRGRAAEQQGIYPTQQEPYICAHGARHYVVASR